MAGNLAHKRPDESGDDQPSGRGEDVGRRFRELAAQWRRETEYDSVASVVFMNRAYQQIIALGPAVLPYILDDLEKTRSQWAWALSAISGENPIPPGTNGDAERVTDAWLGWGRERGLV